MRYTRNEAERVSRGFDEPTAFHTTLRGGTVLVLASALIGLATATVLGLGDGTEQRLIFVALATAYTIGHASVELAIFHYQAQLAFTRAGLIAVARSLVILVIALIAVAGWLTSGTGVGLLFAIGVDCVGLVVALPLAISTRSQVHEHESRFGFDRESASLTLYSLVSAGWAYLDIFLVAALLSDAAVAAYGAALRYVAIVIGPLPALVAVLRVRTAQGDMIDSESAQVGLVTRWLKSTAGPALVILGAAAIAAIWVIPFLNGGRYDEAVPIFQILLIVVFAQVVTLPSSNLLIAQERYTLLAWINAAAVLVNVAIAAVAAPLFGVIAVAAVASAVGVLQVVAVTWCAARPPGRSRIDPSSPGPADPPGMPSGAPARAATGRTVARLREVGLRAAAAAALRRTRLRATGTARGWWLARRPVRADPAQLSEALGPDDTAVGLRVRALGAMPTVAAFERSLDGLGRERSEVLLRLANDIVAHRFDLLGSGKVALGPEIDWSRDFKSGRRWPLSHPSLLRDAYFDDSDIKVPWELSRFQHLPLLAAAFRLSGDRAYLREIGAQLDSWIVANPVEMGVNWACTMDVAIRAVNWLATLAICAAEAAEETWFRAAIESLFLHGRFIYSHLEDRVHANHYLSNIAGLLIIAAAFPGPEGAQWVDFCVPELVGEMEAEVRPDGCNHEASTYYHRLVCEMFVCATQAADHLRPGSVPDRCRAKLTKMLDFTAAYVRPDGTAPQIGDNDDGRFLPLADYGRPDTRNHLHLFEQAGSPAQPPAGPKDFPAGGYFLLAGNDVRVLVRCGDTGLEGLGGHAHNDQLSFELSYGSTPLVEDPGTYTYNADPTLRAAFRSTSFHATLQVDGAEQNELPEWPRFPLGDRSRAEAIHWDGDPARPCFVGRHHGFETLPSPALHERRLEMDTARRELLIVDTVHSDAEHQLSWAFPLGDCRDVEIGADHAITEFAGSLRLVIEAHEVEFGTRNAWYSPGYGVKMPRRFLTLSGRSRPGADVTKIRLIVEADGVAGTAQHGPA